MSSSGRRLPSNVLFGPAVALVAIAVSVVVLVVAPVHARADSGLSLCRQSSDTGCVDPAIGIACDRGTDVLIAARGSGEEATDNSGAGGPMASAYLSMRDEFAKSGRNLRIVTVDYPAQDVDTIKLALIGAPNNFFASIDEGITLTKQMLEQFRTSPACSGKRVVLGGYSQGAMVMHRIIYKLGPGYLIDHFVDSALFVADGDRWAGDTITHFGTANFGSTGAGRVGVGQMEPYMPFAGSPPGSAPPGTHISQICLLNDVVCAPKDPGVVARCGKKCPEAGIHASYPVTKDVDGITYLEKATRSLAAFSTSTVPTTSPPTSTTTTTTPPPPQGTPVVLPFTNLDHPQALTFNGAGTVVVGELKAPPAAILKLDSHNVQTTLVADANAIWGITADGAGNIYWTDPQHQIIWKLPAGSATPQTFYTFTGQNQAPWGIAAATDGTLVVAAEQPGSPNINNTAPMDVWKFAPGSTSPSTVPLPVQGYNGLAITGSGDIYGAGLANVGSHAWKLPAGSATAVDLQINFGLIRDIAADNSGNVIVDGFPACTGICIVTDQVYLQRPGSTSLTQLPFTDHGGQLAGLDIDSTGTVAVVDPANNRVLELAAATS